MEKRIRPWINKKIIEYIGEPEPTLVDFICSKVMAGSSPQGILDDVQMVIIEQIIPERIFTVARIFIRPNFLRNIKFLMKCHIDMLNVIYISSKNICVSGTG